MIGHVSVVASSALLVLLAATGADASQLARPAVTRGSPVAAGPRIHLSPGAGPPTSTVAVSGSGFGAHQAVAIYFDTAKEALASCNGQGSFRRITLTVPASAVPGRHWVTGVQPRSGRSAQAAFLVNTNWAQFHNTDSHAGFNPYENVLSVSDVAEMGLDWSSHVGGNVFSSPAVVNGVVYIGSENGYTYAIDAATGTRLWKAHTGIVYSSPAVAAGVVYIASQSGTVYALNAATGDQRWRLPLGSGARSSSSPVVANGVVYAGSGYPGYLYALDAATGTVLWRTRAGGGIFSSPAVAYGMVFVGTLDGYLDAFDAATGKLLWRQNPGGIRLSSPTVANGRVYVGTLTGDLDAFEASGSFLWSFHSTEGIDATAAVADGVVYIDSLNGDLYALDAATGTKLWSFGTNFTFYSSPAIANGVVYTGSDGGDVYALNAATGTVLWSFDTGYAIVSSPAIANGRVYIGSWTGNAVDAFGLPGGPPKGAHRLGPAAPRITG